MKKRKLAERVICGSIPFDNPLDKRKLLHELKVEFGQNLICRIDDNIITYESIMPMRELNI